MGFATSLLQLPTCILGGWLLFGTSAIPWLTALVGGRPFVEALLFISLALIPYTVAKFRLVSGGLELVIEQVGRLLQQLRGRFSVAAHLVTCSRGPVSRMTQSMLYFFAVNLFVNAVPDGFEVDVPKLLRFLDANGDGTLEASEIEQFVYSRTSRLLSAVITTHLLQYLLILKLPPAGWTVDASEERERQSGSVSILERYWRLTAKRAGWWTLLDRIATGVIYAFIAYSWLVALGINPRTVAAAGGAGGLAIGLAAQQVVGNAVAALIILATAPCQVGDEVEVGVPDLRYRGVVREIGWNATAIETTDKSQLIYVPNGVLLETPLVIIQNATQRPATELQEPA